jgi:hypothetical protein
MGVKNADQPSVSNADRGLAASSSEKPDNAPKLRLPASDLFSGNSRSTDEHEVRETEIVTGGESAAQTCFCSVAVLADVYVPLDFCNLLQMSCLQHQHEREEDNTGS